MVFTTLHIREREKWKEVTKIIQNNKIYYPKFPTFISNHGRVKRTYKGNNIPDLIYKKEYDKSGYVQVSLICIDSKGNSVRKYIKVHRLVAYYFVENPNPKKYTIVNHLENSKGNIDVSDNYYKLLEWTDLSGNQKYAVEKNRANFGKGEYHRNHKLKESDIYDIWELINKGKSDAKISKLYNVDSETIRHIRIGISWKETTQKILCTNYLETNN